MHGISLLEVLDDTQCVEVVVEAPPMADEALIERALAGMPEGWMADVVDQGKRLRQVFIQPKRRGGSASDLRNFNRVGQAAAKVVGGAAGKHLRLASQPPEGTGLHDAFAVALEGRTRGSTWRRVDASDKKVVRVSGDRASMEIDCHGQL
jgi:hypothetical protein